MDTPRLRPAANTRTRAATAVRWHRMMWAKQVHAPAAERWQEVDRHLDEDVIVDRAQLVDCLVQRTSGELSFWPGHDRVCARRGSTTLQRVVLTAIVQRHLRSRGVVGQLE